MAHEFEHQQAAFLEIGLLAGDRRFGAGSADRGQVDLHNVARTGGFGAEALAKLPQGGGGGLLIIGAAFQGLINQARVEMNRLAKGFRVAPAQGHAGIGEALAAGRPRDPIHIAQFALHSLQPLAQLLRLGGGAGRPSLLGNVGMGHHQAALSAL